MTSLEPSAGDALRRALTGGLGIGLMAIAAPTSTLAVAPAQPQITVAKTLSSGFVTTKDGVQISCKDWGPKTAQPIVFHHGWPLTADDWDNQMMFFHAKGFRVIAHDRRGRSTQTDSGNQMDTYATAANRAQFFHDVPAGPFYGFNRAGANGQLKTYPSLPHGLCATHPDVVNPDRLAFVKG